VPDGTSLPRKKNGYTHPALVASTAMAFAASMALPPAKRNDYIATALAAQFPASFAHRRAGVFLHAVKNNSGRYLLQQIFEHARAPGPALRPVTTSGPLPRQPCQCTRLCKTCPAQNRPPLERK